MVHNNRAYHEASNAAEIGQHCSYRKVYLVAFTFGAKSDPKDQKEIQIIEMHIAKSALIECLTPDNSFVIKFAVLPC